MELGFNDIRSVKICDTSADTLRQVSGSPVQTNHCNVQCSTIHEVRNMTMINAYNHATISYMRLPSLPLCSLKCETLTHALHHVLINATNTPTIFQPRTAAQRIYLTFTI
ncbi:hypothetical protein ABKN59_004219 [Abortiporus biennis]